MFYSLYFLDRTGFKENRTSTIMSVIAESKVSRVFGRLLRSVGSRPRFNTEGLDQLIDIGDRTVVMGVMVVRWCNQFYGDRSIESISVANLYKSWFKYQARINKFRAQFDEGDIVTHAGRIRGLVDSLTMENTHSDILSARALASKVRSKKKRRFIEELRSTIIAAETHLDSYLLDLMNDGGDVVEISETYSYTPGVPAELGHDGARSELDDTSQWNQGSYLLDS
jgi:hypothetical protein